MPSLFGSRRHAPPVQPLTRETADPNAATAAASAFMRRGSNASLSSAAAAAALRARPMTPTNVADVQSKRMNRRSPSVSSLSGGRDRGSRRELQRSPSVGSMIERTFRSPSPGRSPASRDRNVPPVPSIPNVDRIVADRKSSGEQRKGASLQTQPFKTASEKMRDGQRGSWFGGATAGDPDNVRTSDSVLRSATGVPEPRSGSVSPSINFSYPRARMQSPSPSTDDQALVYDPNSRRMVPQGELVTRSQSVRQVSEKPRKKKQDVARTGSHLSRGTVGRTQAPALEAPQPLPTEVEPEPEQEPKPKPEASVSAIAPGQPQAAAKKKKKKKQALEQPRPAPAEEQTMEQGKLGAAEVVGPRTVTEPSLVEGKPGRAGQEEQPAQQTYLPPAVAASPVTAVNVANGVANGQPQTPETRKPDAVRKTRPPSESPARSAHFAPATHLTPATDQLAVKHEPPPRSVSPRKSAMKLANPRGMSPSDDGSEASGRGSSPQRPEDSALGRKKSARVSWDDRSTVVVGEAAQPNDTESPTIPSPQAKKPWHSIVTKYTKKDSVNLEGEETMSPRPALPLFGSVREKKVKEPEERPLVRPSELPRAQPGSVLSESNPEAEAGQSSDAAVGAAFMQDQAFRNAANISKFREPLPPVVTSVEGSAYDDDDLAESSDGDLDTDVTTEPDDATEKTPSRSTEGVERLTHEPSAPTQTAPEAVTEAVEGVPTISISHPSPHPQDPKDNAFSNEYLDLPGGFPQEHFKDAAQNFETPAEDVSADAAVSSPSRSTEPLTVTPPIMDDIEEEEEDTDRCSIYSDAYEDLGEVNGEGFMSLDAVVESPSCGKVAKKIHEQVLAQPEDLGRESFEPPLDTTQSPDVSKAPKDWENAKSYWKSLSTEQRRRLEIEALSEGGEDADTETETETETTVRKDAKKTANKSTKAIEKPMQPLHDERSYQIQPGTKWSDEASGDAAKRATGLAVQPKAPSQNVSRLRQSMRSEQAAAHAGHDQPGSMRRSMRTGPPERAARRSHPAPAEPETTWAASAAGVGMRKSFRGTKTSDDTFRPSVSQSGRPVSYNPPPAIESSKLHKRNVSADNYVKPTLRRRGSDDSVSSFTRARAASSSGQGFRRSMRAQEPSPTGARGSGRFSLRSLSPPGFRRNSVTSIPSTANSFAGGGMRQSMRAGSAGPAENGSRLSPFKRSPGGKKGKKTKSGSRFADSSDEDEGLPSFFSSRFADSSDEDDALRPHSKGKGMPRSLRGTDRSSGLAAASAMGVSPGARNGAQPELPDSEDDMAQPQHDASHNGQKSTLRRSRSGRGTMMPVQIAGEGEEAARPSNKRRGSFMSILRRKKEPSNKISRDVGESAARRDTRLERTPSELAVIRRNSLVKIGPSWPLPEPEDEDASESTAADKTRPSTAHGPAGNPSNPSAFLQRRSTSQGIVGSGHEQGDAEQVPPVPELPPQHKKKKFGALRKIFGIHD